MLRKTSALSKLLRNNRKDNNLQFLIQLTKFSFSNQKPVSSPWKKNFKELSQQSTKAEAVPDFKKVQSNHLLRVSKSLENWTKKALNDFTIAFSEATISKQYDESKLFPTIIRLWELFSGIQKVHDKPHQSEVAAQDNRLITEVFIYDRATIQQLKTVIKEITEFHEANIDRILQNPKYFCYMVRTLSRFETSYKNIEFWNLVSKVMQELIAIDTKSPSPANKEHIFALIKRLSEFKYYHTQLANKVVNFSTSQALENLNQLQSKALAHLQASTKLPTHLNSLASVLFTFQTQKDEFRKKVIQEISAYIKETNDVHDLALSINKFHKVKSDPECQKLFEMVKRKVISNLNNSEMSLVDFSLLCKVMLDTVEFKRGHFERLWETFAKVVEKQDPKNLQLSETVNILHSVVRHQHSSDEKMQFIQNLVLMAVENTLNKIEPATRSPIQEQEEQEDDTNIEESRDMTTNFLLKILNSLTYRKENFTLNPKLIQTIYTYFADNLGRIAVKEYANFVYYSAEIFSRLKKDSLQPEFLADLKAKADKLHDEFKVALLSDLGPLSQIVLVRTFQSYCVLNLINEDIYRVFEAEITKKVTKGLDCLRVLKALVDLHEVSGGQLGFSTAVFEELLTRRFILALPNSHISEYTIYPHLLKELTTLPSYKFILQGFHDYLCNNFKKLGIEKICFIMHTSSKHNLSDRLLEEAIPFFKMELAKGKVQLEVIRRIINIYVNNIAGSPEFFAILESKVVEEAKAYLQHEAAVDRKHATLDFVNIFFELTKSYVQNPELLPLLEKILKRDNQHYNFDELTASLTGLGTYLSENVALMKEILKRFNEKLSTYEEQRNFMETAHAPTLQNFQHAMVTVELEYKNKINVEEFPNVLAVSKSLMERIDQIRDKKNEGSKFQRNISKELELLEIPFEVEKPIGIYLTDVLIKPNLVIEIAGVSHYRRNTTEYVWRYLKKVRQLEKMGYKVVTIPYFEWEKYEHTHLRATYLSKKIDEVCQ